MIKLLKAIVLLLFTSLVAITLLIYTNIGNQILLKTINALPLGIAIEYQSGTLNQDLKLTRFHYADEELAIIIDNIDLDLQLSCLYRFKICVNSIQAQQLLLTLEDNQNQADINSEQSSIDANHANDAFFGFNLTAEYIQLAQAQLTIYQDQYHIKGLQGGINITPDGLIVKHLHSQFFSLQIAQTPTPKTINANLEQQLQQTIALNGVELEFALDVEQARIEQFDLILDNKLTFSNVDLMAHWQGYQLDAHKLNFNWNGIEIAAQQRLIFDRDYPLVGTLSLSSPNYGQWFESIDISNKGDFSTLFVDVDSVGKITAKATGALSLITADLPFNAKVTLPKLTLSQPQDITFSEIDLSINGDLNSQSVQFIGDSVLFQTQSKPIRISGILTHNQDMLSLSQAQLTLDQGKLDFSGNYSLKDNSAVIAVLFKEANLQEFAPWLPEVINGQADISQLASPGALTFNAQFVNSSYRSVPWQSQISVDINNDLSQFKVNQFDFSYGGNLVSVVGEKRNKWDLLVDAQLLNVDSLRPLGLPLSAGQGQISASLLGEQPLPLVTVNGDLNGISYPDLLINKLSLTAKLDLNKNDYYLDVNAVDYRLFEVSQQQFGLISRGNLNQQHSSITTSGQITLDTNIQTRYDNDEIHAQFNQLTINTAQKPFKLQAPLETRFNLKNYNFYANKNCLNHEKIQLCLQQPLQWAEQRNMVVSINGDIEELNNNLPNQPYQLTGNVNGHLKAQWLKGQSPETDLKLTILDGSIKNTVIDKSIAFDQLELVAHGHKVISTALSIKKAEQLITSKFTVSDDQQRQINGSFHAENIELEPMLALSSQLQSLKGTLNASSQFSGPLNNPVITGNITLRNGELTLLDNPSQMANINLDLNFIEEAAGLKGSANMGEGKLNIIGEIIWPNQKIDGYIKLEGNNLEVSSPPIAAFKIDPKLRFDIVENGISATGTIDAHTGIIQLVSLPEGGVAVSGDVIYLDNVEVDQANLMIPIFADVNINVGPDIKIEGFGLNGELLGKLTYRQEQSNVPLLFGDIRVAKGNYQILGQTLNIPRGEIQFSGPLELPSLNIEASKKILKSDIIVGVRISGTPQTPNVIFFSDPAMEQAEILSYIVNGRGLNANKSDNSMLAGAALSFGQQSSLMSGIGNTASQLVESIGFSNVELDSNDDGRVAVSGYIGENLMVKYGMGVFKSENQLSARYFLLKNWYLEVISKSIESSVDMYYNFDINTSDN
ncbi:translocation/assembly module TamB domain-containing protein [Paraferrimonas sp. SM1919]|uniref:translocation/assembly module TamB domain-containing protein n=1 Tax=Paraferrimonas sp. SM1919 TaxID=2662263 RepID=UPI0013D288A2|nr:translocation/assembly module TamB domain-containing protein [Paraferrimonas sp. SM1919]